MCVFKAKAVFLFFLFLFFFWLEIIFIIPSRHVQITFQKHEHIIHVFINNSL